MAKEHEVIFRDLDGTIAGENEDNTEDISLEDKALKAQEEELQIEFAEEELSADKEEADNSKATEEDDKVKADPNIDEDLRSYTPEIQQRIMRERRAGRQALQDAVNDKQFLHEELKQERLRARQLEKYAINIAVQKNASDIKATRAALLQAEEDGDVEKKIDAQLELNRLTLQSSKIESRKEEIEQENQKVEEAKPTKTAASQPPQKNASATDGELSEEGRKWLAKNASWVYGNSPEVTRFLRSAAADLVNDIDINSVDFYETLNGLVKSRFPHIIPVSSKATPNQPPKSKKGGTSPVAGVSPSSDPVVKKGKVILTKADLRNMEVFNMDPKNPKHLQEYARNMINN